MAETWYRTHETLAWLYQHGKIMGLGKPVNELNLLFLEFKIEGENNEETFVIKSHVCF